MHPNDPISIELRALAAHLHAQRTRILEEWSRAAQLDPKITAVTTLSRAQFYDHIPNMLDALENRLQSTIIGDQLTAKQDETTHAEGHGLQRWQQGYNEQEVMREWVWLNACLGAELARYALGRPELPAAVMSTAWRLVSEFLVCGMSESVSRYAQMQRADANARLLTLEDAHRQLASVEQQRAEAWREATHDLRGNLSIVENVTYVMQLKGASEKTLGLLGRSVASLTTLLNDLTTQARLDAGHETRDVRPFDAAAELAGLCASLAPLAAERGLFFDTEGPDALHADGDRVKVCRIAQNLIINALAYTQQGGVRVAWAEAEGSPRRWTLCVQDTGPGLDTGGTAPLSAALDAATREGQQVAHEAAKRGDPAPKPEPAPTLPSTSSRSASVSGEGIGLSIVKRLCELLDATLELQTRAGEGSTFRVTFPAHYAKG